MMRPGRILGLVLWFGLVAGNAGHAWAEQGCPAAADALALKELDKAEDLARKCLESNPSDRESRMLLSRALGYSGKHDGALEEVGRVRAAYPEDVEALVWFARLLYWQGKTEQAYQALEPLRGEQADQETAMLLGDITTAMGLPDVAEPWYWSAAAKGAPRSAVLAKIAHLQELQGKKGAATALLREACDIGDAASVEACNKLEESGTPVSNLRWVVGLQPSYLSVLDRPDAWNFMGWVGGRLTSELYTVLSGELRSRDYGEGMRRDFFLQGTANYRFNSTWSIEGAVGGAIERVFSPTLSVYVEPSLAVSRLLVASLKLWHLQFGDNAVEVLSPHLDFYFGDFMLDLRYYLSASEDGVGHAVTGKLHWFLRPVRLNVGGGTGDKADYLDSFEGGDGFFWFLSAGLDYGLPSHTHLTFDYSYRDEAVADQSYRFHQFLFGIYQWF